VSPRLAVSGVLPGRWEPLPAASASVLRWRLRDAGRVVAAASLEVLERADASSLQFAAAAASAPAGRRRAVERDGAERVVILDVVADAGAREPAAVRLEAGVTTFFPTRCLQVRLVTRDLLLFDDLGASVRALADALHVEEVA
jgi:hypothetical protein